MGENTVDVKEEKQGDVLIIGVTGRVDANTAPGLEEKVLGLIDDGNHKVALDFSGVDYLSSAGMRFLLSATKKVKSKSGKLVTASLQDGVMEVIKMAGFNNILDIASSKDEALTKF